MDPEAWTRGRDLCDRTNRGLSISRLHGVPPVRTDLVINDELDEMNSAAYNFALIRRETKLVQKEKIEGHMRFTAKNHTLTPR